jgi:hypothetical protein
MQPPVIVQLAKIAVPTAPPSEAPEDEPEEGPEDEPEDELPDEPDDAPEEEPDPLAGPPPSPLGAWFVELPHASSDGAAANIKTQPIIGLRTTKNLPVRRTFVAARTRYSAFGEEPPQSASFAATTPVQP